MGGRYTCNSDCIRLYGGFSQGKRQSPYLVGKSIHYCSECRLYFDTDKTVCQCCGVKMRVKPKSRFQSRRNPIWDEMKDARRI